MKSISTKKRKCVLSLLLLMLTTIMFAACSERRDNRVDTFKTKSGKEITFHAIKHGSIRITYNGKEIEVDPVIKIKPETDYSKFPKADYIFVTHEHFDHCDTVAILQLEKPSTIIITNENCSKIIGKGKVMHNRWSSESHQARLNGRVVIEEGEANGDHLQLADDITVDAVPAYNTTPDKTKYHPKGRDNGFILTIDGFRIYISGDTEDIPEMVGIKNIDVAFLSTNQPFTMTPEQCVKAAKTIKPKVLFPYHYSDTDINRVVELLRGSGIDVRIRNYQ